MQQPATRLEVVRNEKGRIANVFSTDPAEPVLWVDLWHGTTSTDGEGIYLRMFKCPFTAANPIRFYVDLCDKDMDKELFTQENPDMPERFCQIIRRRLQDPQYATQTGTLLKFIGYPKKYADGTISSIDGVLTKNVGADGRGVPFAIPSTESRPMIGSLLADRGEYEENYDDDFMIGLALWLPVETGKVRGMRLIRNDLAQLRLFDRRNGQQLDEKQKNTYRMVFTYKRREVIGNYAHFLRTDAIGTRIPHRLTLPLERPEFQMPPLSPDEVAVPDVPSAMPMTPDLSTLKLSPSAAKSLTPPKSANPLRNPTGLEPEFRDKIPFSWADYPEDSDPLIVEAPKYSLDALTGAIALREQRRVRERSPAASPLSGEQPEQKYRKSL